MAASYFETPNNWKDIEDYVISDTATIIREVIRSNKVLFYDTCSFRYHSNLPSTNQKQVIQYFRQKKMTVILTRIIVMELASHSGNLDSCYVKYVEMLKTSGVTVVVFDEEMLYDILSVCFATNEAVNSYLLWSVRSLKAPVSTITDTLNSNVNLKEQVIVGKKQKNSDIYKNFFREVRRNKTSGDNLGEELLAICIHILSHLPGVKDGKLCVITDDKGGAGRINALLQSANAQYKGSKVIIYSTPKIIQSMIHSGMNLSRQDLESLLPGDSIDYIRIIATTEYDFDEAHFISLPKHELVEKMLIPGSINILF